MTGVLIRNIRGKDTDTEEMRRLCEDGGRDGSEAAVSQGMLATTRSQERVVGLVFPQSLQKTLTLLTTSGPHNCEGIHFCYLKPPN